MIDKKNLILVTAVLIISAIIGLVIPYLQYDRSIKNIQTIATTTSNGMHATVLYGDKGFEPNSITIKVGTTVEWFNNSSKQMWVASNPHPAHTDLSGFDERGVGGNVEPSQQSNVPVAHAHSVGGAYRYTFLRVGHWGYHNHLMPEDRGTIIVEQ